MTQGELGARMREAGFPMDKAAVQRVEKGERGLSLDEALAFAVVLDAVPAHLFTPPGEERVALTRNFYDLDGTDMRTWLRYGKGFMFAAGDLPAELVEDRAMHAMAVHAQALVDAKRNGDSAGIQDAYHAMAAVLDAERERLEAAKREGADA
jgi:hypothetical protein